jgi:hypothetical protein
MSIRIFVDDTPNKDGKYMVLQEDSKTEKPFGVKDFDTKRKPKGSLMICSGRLTMRYLKNPPANCRTLLHLKRIETYLDRYFNIILKLLRIKR